MKWLPKLIGFDYEILYKQGSENQAANALSRIPTSAQLLTMVLSTISNPSGGHSGVQATLKRITGICYWRKLRQQVKVFVAIYKVCQANKPDLSAYPGLLQPLPIPKLVWSEISMDFIEGLPSSHGKSAIFVVVDRLSKYAHFIPLSHPFTAVQIAQVFSDNVYKLHGLPKVIVGDREKMFVSLFWKELFKALKVSLHLSTTYHPQTDGQTEMVNRCLECYLRCMSGEKPKAWATWVNLAEYWYNTTYHTSLKTTPYEVLYGQPPPNPIAYVQGQCLVDVVDRILAAREFDIRQWVYLKLQPHRQVSFRTGKYNKLNPKYYGPFQVIQRVGQVAYKLELPSSSLIYPVFHVSQLKKYKGPIPDSTPTLPQCNAKGELTSLPVAILDRRLGKVGNSAQVYVLVQWSNGTRDDAT
ncbi:retrotransposon-related protein [Tanacetum coccineum]